MGILDALKGVASSALGAEQHTAIANAATSVLSGQSGGLGGLVTQLSQAGLGPAVNSWVGTGQNAPVTGDQLGQALGSDVVFQIAKKAGISPEVAKSGLAFVLPLLIDKATPKGQIPSGGGSLADGLGGLAALLRQG